MLALNFLFFIYLFTGKSINQTDQNIWRLFPQSY